jgi:hypothetical protein
MSNVSPEPINDTITPLKCNRTLKLPCVVIKFRTRALCLVGILKRKDFFLPKRRLRLRTRNHDNVYDTKTRCSLFFAHTTSSGADPNTLNSFESDHNDGQEFHEISSRFVWENKRPVTLASSNAKVTCREITESLLQCIGASRHNAAYQ